MNEMGMGFLNQAQAYQQTRFFHQKNEAAFKYLKMAEKVCLQAKALKQSLQMDQMLALTYNNLGCIYKKNAKPNVAL